MAIKLDNLSCWKLVPPGEALMLPGETGDTRRIRIDLNCEDRTWLYVSGVDISADAQFLAAVGPGLETVEFYAGGELAVRFDPASPDEKASQVWVYTAEIDPNVSAVPDAVSFTEMHQRRARNPELEMMQLLARQNERRMEEQLARMEALLTERVSHVDPAEVDDPAGEDGTGTGGGAGTAPSEDQTGAGEQSGGSGDDDADG